MKVYPPAIHMNGTSVKALMDGYVTALHDLRRARESLAATKPHPRDFYVQEDGDAQFRMAATMHDVQLARIDKTLQEIEELYSYVL